MLCAQGQGCKIPFTLSSIDATKYWDGYTDVATYACWTSASQSLTLPCSMYVINIAYHAPLDVCLLEPCWPLCMCMCMCITCFLYHVPCHRAGCHQDLHAIRRGGSGRCWYQGTVCVCAAHPALPVCVSGRGCTYRLCLCCSFRVVFGEGSHYIAHSN